MFQTQQYHKCPAAFASYSSPHFPGEFHKGSSLNPILKWHGFLSPLNRGEYVFWRFKTLQWSFPKGKKTGLAPLGLPHCQLSWSYRSLWPPTPGLLLQVPTEAGRSYPSTHFHWELPVQETVVSSGQQPGTLGKIKTTRFYDLSRSRNQLTATELPLQVFAHLTQMLLPQPPGSSKELTDLGLNSLFAKAKSEGALCHSSASPVTRRLVSYRWWMKTIPEKCKAGSSWSKGHSFPSGISNRVSLFPVQHSPYKTLASILCPSHDTKVTQTGLPSHPSSLFGWFIWGWPEIHCKKPLGWRVEQMSSIQVSTTGCLWNSPPWVRGRNDQCLPSSWFSSCLPNNWTQPRVLKEHCWG